jgi:ribosomal protein S17E
VNNKAIISLAASAFMLMSSSAPLAFAADSAAEQLGIQVETNGTFIMQGIMGAKVDEKIKNFLRPATYKINLKLTKEFENNGKIIAHFEGEKSTEINNKINTYGSINPSYSKDIELETDIKDSISYSNLIEKDSNLKDLYIHYTDITLLRITELYYQQALFNNKLTVNFGKLSLGRYFAGNKYANDETSQFVTGSFTTDKVIDAPSQTIALALNYAVVDNYFDIAYAYFTKNTGNLDINGFNILQATYKSSEKGNCRLYAWLNNDKKYSYYNNKTTDDKKSGTYGFGISADQAIIEEIGVFFRAGYKNHRVGIKNSEGKFSDNILSLFWNTGIQVKGSIWSRTNDVTGFAIGQIYGSKGLKTGQISYKNCAETQIELYYKFALNNHIAITPVFQYFISPNGEKSHNNIFVWGIRTSFTF